MKKEIENSKQFIVKVKKKDSSEYEELSYSTERNSFTVDFSSINEIIVQRDCTDNPCQDHDQDVVIADQDADQCDVNDPGSGSC